ncbi:class I SAM-dependent methyltransferase [Rhizobium sp. SL86]|uniref:class I SAM-dependent methyltransferase n=1 Tax=Rhizobium sp. SL86 TaxID=2995148 RepID=UPI002272B993|nr:class I SAM-dependent methyltransferase [Rhizobium sp. SL86]MCY1668183.1 class I SAM-dependent methyltransferase [Rhizobium sp. SL86]
MNEEENGWSQSAPAWIESQGDNGDFSREFVLDPAIDRIMAERRFDHALDVGCGEGRFCRRMRTHYGIGTVTGIDPTEPLLAAARKHDPHGTYLRAEAEALPFPEESFDLVVSYLTLIDIPDLAKAIAEMTRVLRPQGTLLIANLNPFITACGGTAWVKDGAGRKQFVRVDRYLEEHADWQAWRGIRILNHHRPMSRYMTLLLEAGLRLTRFEEPPAIGGPPAAREAYNRVPYAHLMEWTKP